MTVHPSWDPPHATVLAELVEEAILAASVELRRHKLLERAKDRLAAQRDANLLSLMVNRARLKVGYCRPDRGSRGLREVEHHSDDDWLTLSQATERLGVRRAWRDDGTKVSGSRVYRGARGGLWILRWSAWCRNSSRGMAASNEEPGFSRQVLCPGRTVRKEWS